jgi:ketosteroid isomerase-like protein
MSNSQTSSDRYELGRAFHAALIAGDWDRMRGLMDPDVVWTLPGDNRISGSTAPGPDAVVERARLIASFGVRFDLEHILVSRDHMALALHNTAQRDGRTLDEHLATVCFLREGRISRIETFLSDESGMNAFFV